ncbi:hypothetical protein PCE1_001435 [Barthelona sp. PCE]
MHFTHDFDYTKLEPTQERVEEYRCLIAEARELINTVTVDMELDDFVALFNKAYFLYRNYYYCVAETLGRLMVEFSAIQGDLSKLYSEFIGELFQNETLAKVFKRLSESDDYVHKRVAHFFKGNFQTKGLLLDPADRERVTQLWTEVAQHSSTFQHNVKLFNQRKHYVTHDELKGVAASDIESVLKSDDEGTYILLSPVIIANILKQIENREVRRRIYIEYVNKPDDNEEVMAEILRKRETIAEMLSLPHIAEVYNVMNKAIPLDEVKAVCDEGARILKEDVVPGRMAELEEYAGHGIEPWDLGFYLERMEKERFDFDPEAINEYLTLENAFTYMQHVLKDMFDMEMKEVPFPTAWYEDMYKFEFKQAGKISGYVIFDPWFREGKNTTGFCECLTTCYEGAHCVYFVSCAIVPTPEKFVKMRNVQTLLHEFGHCINGLCAPNDLPEMAQSIMSDFNTIDWDVVEVASQFLEELIPCADMGPFFKNSKGECIPEDLLNVMIEKKNFKVFSRYAYLMANALFDLEIHTSPAEEVISAGIHTMFQSSYEEMYGIKPPVENRFAASFNHIWGDCYVAGYYGYFISDVMQAAIWADFDKELYSKYFLEKCAYYCPLDALKAITGKVDLSPVALFKQKGLIS